jgi:Predicted ester cyclase
MKIRVPLSPVVLAAAFLLNHAAHAKTINALPPPCSTQSSPQTTPPAPKNSAEDPIRQEERKNEEVIRNAFASVNRGDLDAYVDYWDLDAKNFNVAIGREGIRRGIEDIRATFPDWHMEITELIARGDSVVARFAVTGTHRGVGKLPMNGGMLVGVQPTGKHFNVEHIHWFKLRNGKIVEHTATRNDIGMMRQLGLLPPTGLPK